VYLDKGYRQTLGSCSYLSSLSRPDTQQSTSVLTRYGHKPGKLAYEAALRHVRYLKFSEQEHLTYRGHATTPVPWSNIIVKAWVDADHGSCPDTRKSYTGIIIHIGIARDPTGTSTAACPGGAVLWSCRRQGISHDRITHASTPEDDKIDTAMNSTDAESIGLTDVGAPLRCLRNLLRELGAPQRHPSEVYNDNSPAIKNIYLDTSPRLKQWNMRLASTRQLIREQVLEFIHIYGTRNHADALTKRLSTPKFRAHTTTMLGRFSTCRSSSSHT
jgi:hypothetical protein